MIKVFKKNMIKWWLKLYVWDLKNQGCILEDIKINIEETDKEVYGRLKLNNVVRYYEDDTLLEIGRIKQPVDVVIHTEGWRFFKEEYFMRISDDEVISRLRIKRFLED